MVGKLFRMRVSSVIPIFPACSSIGTLKSTRTSTRLPRTSRSRRASFMFAGGMEYWSDGVVSQNSFTPLLHGRILFPQHLQQFHAAIAVAPLVVVPADDFHETVAEHDRQFAVENARVRVAYNVPRDERLIAVFEHPFVALVARGIFECGIDRINRRVLCKNSGEIGHGTVRRRHTKRAAI